MDLQHNQDAGLVLSKFLGHLAEEMHVNIDQFQKIKGLVQSDSSARVIFLPLFQSYADPLILHYIHHHQDIELGFTFGGYQDSPEGKLGSYDRF